MAAEFYGIWCNNDGQTIKLVPLSHELLCQHRGCQRPSMYITYNEGFWFCHDHINEAMQARGYTRVEDFTAQDLSGTWEYAEPKLLKIEPIGRANPDVKCASCTRLERKWIFGIHELCTLCAQEKINKMGARLVSKAL